MTCSVLPGSSVRSAQPTFAAVAAGELGRFLGFDLAAIVVHRRAAPAGGIVR